MKQVTINNGEKITNQGLSVFDLKGKPLEALPDGWSVVYSASEDPSTVAQFVQDSPGSLGGTVTTEGDDVGTVTFTGTITRPDGSVMLDGDGNTPQLQVTVIHSAPNTADFGVGTTIPE